MESFTESDMASDRTGTVMESSNGGVMGSGGESSIGSYKRSNLLL